ncbi:MAG: alpha/beta hydrolase [Rudaea sp.]
MSTVTNLNSTTVRKMMSLTALRAMFTLGSYVSPDATAERAARLFATPFASSRKRARNVGRDADMITESIEVDGQTLSTYRWGDPSHQPYALLLHGWSSFGLRFLSWVAALRAAGYAVVTFDQPGHGKSGGHLATLPEFAAAARAVGARYGTAALAVGHSFGGAALAMALDDSWQAKRIVLIAPSADMIAAVDRFFRFVKLRDRVRDAFYAWHLRRTGVDPRTLQVERHLRRLGQPCLVIHDLDDREVPWGEGERYAHSWPDARMLTTEGLGHNRIVDNPDVIAAALAFARGETIGDRVLGSPGLI